VKETFSKSLKSKQLRLQIVSRTKSAFLSFKNHLKPSNPKKKPLKQAKNDTNAQNAISPGFESFRPD
jgi:hypothetical protein